MADDSAGRLRAVIVAGHRGDAELPRRHLDDDAHAVRAAALAALERAGQLSGRELAVALTDGSPTVRGRAAELAVRHPDVDLAPLLTDPDPSVVEVAAWAIGEQGGADPTVVATLASVTAEHAEPLCREAAVAALGALGDPEGLPAILGACSDRATVRRRAILALAPFGGAAVVTALEAACTDRDWQVRQAAEDQLAARR